MANPLERIKSAVRKIRAQAAASAAIPAAIRSRLRQRVVPDLRVRSRTGDARWAPAVTFRKRRDGVRAVMAHRLDDVSMRDYDRARMYPVVIDGIRSLVAPAARANVHFLCQRQDVAELAEELLGDMVSDLVRQFLKGGFQFGYHAAEIRWKAAFDVFIPQDGTTEAETPDEEDPESQPRKGVYWPFVWTVDRFAHFSPLDTVILIRPGIGDFAGIRQMYPVEGDNRDITGPHKIMKWTHDQEFDMNYGIPITKGAIPFIEIAEIIWDAVTKYSDTYAVPGMFGKYPQGSTAIGQDSDGQVQTVNNADLMLGVLEDIGGGSRVAFPSEVHEEGGAPRWDIGFFQPAGNQQPYTELLNTTHEQIRLCLGVSDQASSESQKVGGLGDQGAEDKINLHLANVERFLDEFALEFNKVLDRFRIYNAGASCPPLRIFFEPVDLNITKTLLAAIVEILASGQPAQDANGTLIYPDWAKIMKDKGIPTVSVSAKKMASQLYQRVIQQASAQQQAGGNQPGNGQGGEEEGGEGVEAPKPEKPSLSSREAAKLMLTEINGLELPSQIRAIMKKTLAEVVELGEFREEEHPRDQDGKFAKKGEGSETERGYTTRPGGFLKRDPDTGRPVSGEVGSLEGHKPEPMPAHYPFGEEAWKARDLRTQSRIEAGAQMDDRLRVEVGPEKDGENLEYLTDFDTPEIARQRAAIKAWEDEVKPELGVGRMGTAEIDTPERHQLRDEIADDMYAGGAAKKGVLKDGVKMSDVPAMVARGEDPWVTKPEVKIITGPPGSGKSTLVKMRGYQDPDKTGALEIDSDYAKENLPEFNAGRGANLVHEESANIAEMVLARAISSGDNIVLPVVGKSAGSLEKKLALFEKFGYDIAVDNLFIEPERSAESVANRFHKNGRFVPPEYAHGVGTKPLETHREMSKQFGGRAKWSEFTSDEIFAKKKK